MKALSKRAKLVSLERALKFEKFRLEKPLNCLKINETHV